MGEESTVSQSVVCGKNLATGSREPLPINGEVSALRVQNQPLRGRKMAGVTLGVTATVIHTAVRNWSACNLLLVNVDSSDRTCKIYHIPNGGAATDATCIFNETLTSGGPNKAIVDLPLQAGEALQGLTDSADKVTAALYGEVS